MIKYGILILFTGTILILGLTLPNAGLPDPRRDPVPGTQKVAHSSHCAGCHGFDETGKALTDSEGRDVNIYDDWQISMMGLSAHDPFWRATLAHEVNLYPSAAAAIETTCLKCHAPLGSIQSHLSGLPYSFASMLQDSLGLDGVSCSSCHQQPAKNLGSGHTGNFEIDTNRVLFGPYPNPFQGPMQLYVGFEPVFSDHIYSSGVCAGCHTLITETLDFDGTPTGNFFVEQATYHEWLNSVYPAQGKECQSCHLPFIQDSIVIATDFLVLKKRHPFGLHQFFGANTAMLTLMKENRDDLNLPNASHDGAWDESINNNRLSLSRAATIEITPWYIFDDTLHFDLSIKNKSGHKFPSGYPSRLAWLQIVMTDPNGVDTFYANGILEHDGNISGRDHPYEPHHEVSNSEEDVQIYEMVMSDLQGHLTTRLNAAYEPLKDNRLLPVGFRKNHSTYDTVAIYGTAMGDPDYDVTSTAGADNLHYKIPLHGNKGLANLTISFRYLSLPARWMNDLFLSDSLEQVAQFKSMYQGYQVFDELIDEIKLDHLDLSTSHTNEVAFTDGIILYPNPGNGSDIRIELNSEILSNISIHYKLMDLQGKVLQTGTVNQSIQLTPALNQGLYFFEFYDHQRLIAIKPYSVSN